MIQQLKNIKKNEKNLQLSLKYISKTEKELRQPNSVYFF